MKKLILSMALLVSTSAFAEINNVWPHVINLGNHVQVQIMNHTPRNVICSGWIHLDFMSGRRDSLHFYEMVFARQSRFRTIYPRQMNDRIRFASHSIFCH